VNIIICIEFRK